MNSSVKVVADDQGNVIGISKNNPEYGYVRIQQEAMAFNQQGWVSRSVRSTLIKGKVEDLVLCDFSENQELPGKIVIKESLVPFNSSNPDRDLKIAGNSGVICRVDDEPIYRQSFYTTDENAVDDLIQHTNSEEIKQALAAEKTFQSLKSKKLDTSVVL
jgi:hypothetical protein